MGIKIIDGTPSSIAKFIRERKTSDKCCFCGTIMGALVRLHQGWCCIKCFKKLIE